MSLQLVSEESIESPERLVPISNIWLLMAYAADIDSKVFTSKLSNQNFEEELIDTVAELLLVVTKKQLKLGLNLGFEIVSNEVSRLRGKVNHLNSKRANSSAKGKIFCTYETLTHNTFENQLLRTGLQVINGYVKSPSLKISCRKIDQHLGGLGVSHLRVHPKGLRFQTRSAKQFYPQIISLVELILNLDLVSEEDGKRDLATPEKRKEWIYRLYEKAIGGFYRHHLRNTNWVIETGRYHSWPVTEASDGLNTILPRMVSDIEISDAHLKKKIIIDTKYTEIVKPRNFDSISLNSNHIYQIYAYLRTSENLESEFLKQSSGLLLYPSFGESIYEEAMIQGHRCVFATVNLMSDPVQIRDELLLIFKRISRPTTV